MMMRKMTFNIQLQIPLSSPNFELKFLSLLKGYTNVSVKSVKSHIKGTCMLGRITVCPPKISTKHCYYIPASVLPLFFLSFCAFPQPPSETRAVASRLSPCLHLPQLQSAAWFMIEKNGYSEVFSSLCQQAQSLAGHLRQRDLGSNLGSSSGCWDTFFP